MEISRRELGKWEARASFYTKQLEDRAGIIARSSLSNPEDSEWLVREIEEDLSRAKLNIEVLAKALAFQGVN